MATLVLGIVGGVIGTAVAGPGGSALGFAIGSAIGGAVGGAIDNFVLFPMLFPKPTIQGPRLDDLQIQTASEGAIVKYPIGPRNRLAGELVWTSGLREVKSTTRVGKGGGGQKVDNYSYFVDLFIVISQTERTPINRIRQVYADTKLIYDGTATDKYNAIRFRYGNESSPDSLLESYMGAGNVPKYKKSCGIVIENLALADYGNRIPNITAVCEQDADMSVGGAISVLLDRADLDPSEYDTSRVPGCFKGYTVQGPQPTDRAIDPVMVGYALLVQERGEQLVFFPIGAEEEFSVTASDLASGQTDRPIKFADLNNYVVPAEVHVRYVNIDDKLQQGAEPATRIDHKGSTSLAMDLPLTLDPDEASAIALRSLWAAEQERQTVSLKLSPRWLFLGESDVVNVTVEGVTHRILISDITIDPDYVVRIEGRISHPDQYNQTGVGSTMDDSIGPNEPPETLGYVFDGPALLDEHTSVVGVYFAIASEADYWPGAKLFSSVDGTTYTERGSVAVEGVLGITVAGPGEGVPDMWNRSSHIDVQLTAGEIASVSEEECLAGANRFAIRASNGEWEVIGAATVTALDGEGEYRLTDLLRGLRGTEHVMAYHLASGAPFIYLSGDGSISWWARGLSGVGTNDYYKTPALGGVIADYDSQRLSIRGRTVRPFTPSHLEGVFGFDVVCYGQDLSVNGTDQSFNSTLPERFADIQVGQPITTSGFSNGGNNSTFTVIGKPSNQKLIVAGTLTTEGSGSWVTLKRGEDNALCLRWQRRTKRFIAPFQTNNPPLSADESPERYLLEFRQGGSLATLRRSVYVNTPSYVYTEDERVADGFGSNYAVSVWVYQVSNEVGNSMPAFGSYEP